MVRFKNTLVSKNWTRFTLVHTKGKCCSIFHVCIYKTELCLIVTFDFPLEYAKVSHDLDFFVISTVMIECIDWVLFS